MFLIINVQYFINEVLIERAALLITHQLKKTPIEIRYFELIRDFLTQ